MMSGQVRAGRRSLAVLLAILVLTVGIAPAPVSAAPGSAHQPNVHQLSGQLRQVIRQVTKLDLPCATRNTLVRRLRAVDDALVSGRRTAAAGLLGYAIDRVVSMRQGAVLTSQESGFLQDRLTDIREKVGTGWPAEPGPTTRWPALPSCAAPRDGGNVGEQDVFQASDAKFVVQAIVTQVPIVGKFLGPLVAILWPNSDPTANVASMISAAVSAQVRTDLVNELAGLNAVLNAYLSDEQTWMDACDADPGGVSCASARDVVSGEWLDIRLQFILDEPAFQSIDYREDLLDMYAQWETLFLTFLREGYLAAPSWGWTGSQIDSYVTWYITLQFNDSAHGVRYVDDIYQTGRDRFGYYRGTCNDTECWNDYNGYERQMTLGVKVFEDMWPLLDPRMYPDGDPGFVDTRIVYSDAIGEAHAPVLPPADVHYPLSDLTYWELEQNAVGLHGDGFIQAIETDNAPDVGTLTGNTNTNGGTKYEFDTTPANTTSGSGGPIVQAGASTDQRGIAYPDWIAAGLSLTFANGTDHVDAGWPSYKDHQYTYAFDDMVLVGARLMGPLKTRWGGPCSDSIIFGFRYSDSLSPAG
jgi:hypothetical protein